MTPEPQSIKQKIDKLVFIKMKSFVLQKTLLKERKDEL